MKLKTFALGASILDSVKAYIPILNAVGEMKSFA